MVNTFGHRVGKIPPLVLNYPVCFVPGSARCSSALCLLILTLSDRNNLYQYIMVYSVKKRPHVIIKIYLIVLTYTRLEYMGEL